MPKELEDLLDELSVEVRAMKARRGSRYAGAGADPAVIDHLAEGGAVERGTGKRVGRSYGTKSAGGDEDWRRLVEPGRSGSSGGSLAKAILDIKLHRTEGMRAVWDDKALAEATDTAGGFLLEPEIAQDVMMLIRNRAATLKLKVTTVNPRSKRFDLPGLAAGASASWLAENAALPASAQTFQIAAQMVPRPIGGLVASRTGSSPTRPPRTSGAPGRSTTSSSETSPT
jgi:HK97 family phage major capsid protein